MASRALKRVRGTGPAPSASTGERYDAALMAAGDARAEARGHPRERCAATASDASRLRGAGQVSEPCFGLARPYWPLVLVLAAFAVAAVVVPTLTPIATTDDWTYSRSAQILLAEGRLTVFPVVVATALFPIGWGAMFGLLLGPDLGVFRLSTVVMTGIGGLALYGLCRELGISRARGSLAVAAYLFNPLVFVLAFTFMTDPFFVALLIAATWLFARSLGPSRTDGGLLLMGSGVAALALLTRHQGALIVPAVAGYLLVSRRLRFDRASLLVLARLAALPLLAAAAYYAWLRSGPNVAGMQTTFVEEIAAGGWDGAWWLARWLTVFIVAYLGFFALPIVAAVLPFDHYVVRGIRRRGWVLFVPWAAAAAIGALVLAGRGELMPYLPQFFGPTGLGPPDLLGGRPELIGSAGRAALTIVCILATLLLALVAARGVDRPPSIERSRAGLVLSIGVWQAIGIYPPSFHFLGWSAGSVDRYLLPLAPIAIVLALWGLRSVPLALPLGWSVAVMVAFVSVAGTRDYLVFMREVWSMGEQAAAAGAPLDRLDAGAGWDGYYLYEDGLANGIAPRTAGGPWWVYMNAPATDSTYVVAGAPLPGYDVIDERAYSSWLLAEPPRLYLMRRQGETGPP